MKTLSRKMIFTAIAMVIVVVSALIYFAGPSYLYGKAIDGLRKEAGLTIESVSLDEMEIVYAEGGTGDAIVLLHGFGGSKENWLSFAKYLTPGYRVIIPDLPGFGESSKPQDVTYSIQFQVEKIMALARKLELPGFHIVGNSMGGNIAGSFAADYPEMVYSLGLFDSAGVQSPEKSELTLLLEKGVNPLLIEDPEAFDRLLEINFVQPPALPSFIKRHLAKNAMKAAPFNVKIFQDLMNTGLTGLEGNLQLIEAPTLIVWGDSDKVLHISAVAVFEKNIKNAESAIIRECGHLPMMEKPEETSSVYLGFLKEKNP